MKKINIILVGLLFMVGFNACQEDELVTINPLAETGELTFKLNQPKYADYIYALEEDNNEKNMDTLTCDQPDYGFTAAVTYHVQASFSEDMTDNVQLATPVNGEKVPVNIKDMNKAILALYKGQMPNPPTVINVYVRLKAIVSTATPTPLDSIPIVKPAYSNVIKLKILPYFMEDLTSYDKAKKLVFWYLIGLGDKKWTNDLSGLGVSIVPLSVVEGNKYDSEGNGIFTYTGYFNTNDEFKIIRDLGSWEIQWGNNGSAGINSPVMKNPSLEPSNFKVPENGYYTILLNSINNTLTIEKTSITPPLFDNMGLVGAINDWGNTPDIEMHPFLVDEDEKPLNNHVWYTECIFSSDGEVKFRVDNKWDNNWGGIHFPIGIATDDGPNIPAKGGKYLIIFNDVDGFYTFIQK